MLPIASEIFRFFGKNGNIYEQANIQTVLLILTNTKQVFNMEKYGLQSRSIVQTKKHFTSFILLSIDNSNQNKEIKSNQG